MPELTLYLIRHAQAPQRGPEYPDDRLRPLIKKGVQQAAHLRRFLAAQGVVFDQLCSSPLTRAAQTAEPLTELLAAKRHLHYLDSLAAEDYGHLLTDLRDRLRPKDRVVALVGHEPYLSELASWLLCGDAGGVAIKLGKAALLTLTGPLEPGRMALESLVSARSYKRLA